MKNKFTLFGIILILSGLLFNEYSIKLLSGFETKFDGIEKRICIICIQGLLLTIGIYIFKRGKEAVGNLVLFFSSICVIVVMSEIFLSLSFFDCTKSNNPLWIPAKYKIENNKIQEEHKNSSLGNVFLFNDVNHSLTKSDKKLFRIAVLGDSFIWGAGVPDSVIWTHKLANRLNKENRKCEIFNWGKSGWSTKDEFDFLKKHGIKFEYDLLLFAFVVNDPVMDDSDLKLFINPEGFVYRTFLKPLSYIFPNVVNFTVDILNNLFSTYFDYGYFNWLEDHVYTQSNLIKYSQLLKDIRCFCQDRKLDLLFVMTPENHNPILGKYFDKIVSLLEKNKISYINLFPEVRRKLDKYTVRELWANYADGHPGEKVSTVYADYLYCYLAGRYSHRI